MTDEECISEGVPHYLGPSSSLRLPGRSLIAPLLGASHQPYMAETDVDTFLFFFVPPTSNVLVMLQL